MSRELVKRYHWSLLVARRPPITSHVCPMMAISPCHHPPSTSRCPRSQRDPPPQGAGCPPLAASHCARQARLLPPQSIPGGAVTPSWSRTLESRRRRQHFPRTSVVAESTRATLVRRGAVEGAPSTPVGLVGVVEASWRRRQHSALSAFLSQNR